MIETNRAILSNGMRLIHNYDSATAMVALNVLVDCGARDEHPQHTGLAHLLEHLMFSGSANIPDFDSAIECAGGSDNAYTSPDFTNYYSVGPAQNAETLFWLESDRLLRPAFPDRGLEVQRAVVAEEFKQTTLNRPYGDMGHHLRRMLYTVHPYRWPVIGDDIIHVTDATRADVEDIYNRRYATDSIVLSVTGHIGFDQALAAAEKWFGSIPARKATPRNYPQEPLQTAAREVTASGNVPQTALILAFPMAAYGEPGFREADIITDLLASGRSSRFNTRLLHGTDLFTEVDASIAGCEERGYLMLNAKLRDNDAASIDAAREAMLREARLLAEPGELTEEELESRRVRFESNFLFNSVDYLSRAQSLALAEYHGEDINDTVSRYRAATIDDIRRTAARLFVPEHCNTLIYQPR